MASDSEILTKWTLLGPYLNRRQRTLWAAAEAEAIGYGGIALVAKVTSISKPSISGGMRKLKSTKGSKPGTMIPAAGSPSAGRKLTEVNDPQIEQALEKMLSEEIAGDPMNQQMDTQQSPKPQ